MIIAKNSRRRLVKDYGPYMNLRYAVYDRDDTLEVWFSDLERAKDWWAENCERPTYQEERDAQRAEMAALIGSLPDIDEYEELPFM